LLDENLKINQENNQEKSEIHRKGFNV